MAKKNITVKKAKAQKTPKEPKAPKASKAKKVIQYKVKADCSTCKGERSTSGYKIPFGYMDRLGTQPIPYLAGYPNRLGTPYFAGYPYKTEVPKAVGRTIGRTMETQTEPLMQSVYVIDDQGEPYEKKTQRVPYIPKAAIISKSQPFLEEPFINYLEDKPRYSEEEEQQYIQPSTRTQEEMVASMLAPSQEPSTRRRGRPKGSKNIPTEEKERIKNEKEEQRFLQQQQAEIDKRNKESLGQFA